MDFYTRFTDRFRGSKESIQQRLEVYLPILEPIMARYPEVEVLDLGSGRGEWLDLVSLKGWPCRGIDTNASMAAICRERGLRIDELDALEALQREPDDSLAAITGFHIAEHLPFDDLLALVKEANRALVPGGALILETPNPENLTVGLWSFYMDPTHRHPLPPPLLHFVAEDSGFPSPDVLRLNGPEPPSPEASLAQRFDWALSAHPDYALIARKAADAESAPWFDYLQQLTREHQGGLEEFSARLQAHEAEYANLKQRLEKSESSLAQCEQSLTLLRERERALAEELSNVYASRSWRVTAPLRRILHVIHVRSAGSHQPSARGGILLRRLAAIGWIKRPGMMVLDRMPALKVRLMQRIAMASAGAPGQRNHSEEDFHDLESHQMAAVRRESLLLRDALLPARQLDTLLQGVRVEGHVNGSYSLAAVNRQLVQRLAQDASATQFALAPREGERQQRVRQVPGGVQEVERLNRWVGETHLDTIPADAKVSLYHHYPIITDVDASHGLAVALFFWEESIVPREMIEALNRHYAGVLVTAWFVKKALMDSGCRLPIQVVTLPLLPNPRASESRLEDLRRAARDRRVRLLHVSSCFPRKGVDVLLEAFDRLAAQVPEVELTIKTFPNPHNQVQALAGQYVADGQRSRLHIIMEDYDAGQMAGLYQQADLVVLPSRGEGLNMPAIEAGEFSRPLLVTGYGAHTDFAGRDNAWWVGYRFDRAQSHFAGPRSVWVEPGVESLIGSLQGLCQQLLNGDQSLIDHAGHLHSQVSERFLAPAASDSVRSALARLLTHHKAPPPPALSISMLTSWAEPCGIAEYSGHLLEALGRRGTQVEVLAPEGRMDSTQPRHSMAREAWRMKHLPDLNHAAPAGDIVWLQHHFAFFPLQGRLAEQVRQWRQRNRRLYITLHTTRPMLDFDHERRLAARDVLLAFDRVFVHTLDDLNTLKRLGVSDNTTLMPQGIDTDGATPAPEPEPERMRIGSFGFLLPHKGVYPLIQAFAGLLKRNEIPADACLRLVTSVRDEVASRQELERCRKLTQTLGIAERVEWHTDYLPMEEVRRLLAECRLVVLPYQFTLESSSAAVRTAVAACRDVATTASPIFDEVRDITWPLPGFSADDIAQGMAEALNASEAQRHEVHQARQEWIDASSWEAIAGHYQGLFEAALVDRDFTAGA
ncbi:glycosyltransferase [Halomonas sp. ANAO-440]|uniref:glycosyltransferase n=1 Tax=Halomonas sp. ANAO-440 TaxID=2861360 RepID=UPI001CAA7529|nr:glycosyltransferase [Halomonas sp. ANAO-440]MBZ0329362.1 glycosyltransferase [Halomonas sp. ANAO-440]